MWQEALHAYRARVPRFLDDFLAPEGTITQKRSLDETIEHLGNDNRRRKGQNRELSAEIDALTQKIEKERANAQELRVTRVQLEERRDSWTQTATRHERELGETRSQREEVMAHIATDMARGVEMDERITALEGERKELEREETRLGGERKTLEGRIASDNQALKDEERSLKSKMHDLAQAQSTLERLHVTVAERRTEIKGVYDSFSDRHGRDLREFEGRELDEGVDRKTLKGELTSVRGALRDLGSVNLMAVEEFGEVADRYEFLNTQLTDLRSAKQDLVLVTTEIRRESEQLFIETYNKIRKNFHTVFRRLFGGGRAELRLVDPDNVLDSGIDILVQPPGKKA